jgi:hypothetical protein
MMRLYDIQYAENGSLKVDPILCTTGLSTVGLCCSLPSATQPCPV